MKDNKTKPTCEDVDIRYYSEYASVFQVPAHDAEPALKEAQFEVLRVFQQFADFIINPSVKELEELGYYSVAVIPATGVQIAIRSEHDEKMIFAMQQLSTSIANLNLKVRNLTANVSGRATRINELEAENGKLKAQLAALKVRLAVLEKDGDR